MPSIGAGATVVDMLYIAVGLAVALVGADLLDLTKGKGSFRGTTKL